MQGKLVVIRSQFRHGRADCSAALRIMATRSCHALPEPFEVRSAVSDG
jgi:hypothetical protein